MIFDFSRSSAVDDWVSVNDVEKGGSSIGRLERTKEQTALFFGEVTVRNGVGYSSIRSTPREQEFRDATGLKLRLRGDGRWYSLDLELDGYLDDVVYRSLFRTHEGEWQDVFLPFVEFIPTFDDQLVTGAPALNRSRAVSLSLRVEDDRSGPFRLEVSSIETYS